MKKIKTILIILSALIITSGLLYVSNKLFSDRNTTSPVSYLDSSTANENTDSTLDSDIGKENKITIIKGDIEIEDLNRGELMCVHYASWDNYDSLEELKEAADLIITGKVISGEEVSSMASAFKVEVQSTEFGPEHEEVIIYQMGRLDGSRNHLIKGGEYILFLNKQNNDESNSYYIIGQEEQGKFRIKNNKLVNYDLKMQKAIKEKFTGNKQVDDFKDWLNKE